VRTLCKGCGVEFFTPPLSIGVKDGFCGHDCRLAFAKGMEAGAKIADQKAAVLRALSHGGMQARPGTIETAEEIAASIRAGPQCSIFDTANKLLPRRRIVVDIHLGADSWDAMVAALGQIHFELSTREGGEQPLRITTGGCNVGWSIDGTVDESVTQDSYFAAIEEWKKRQ